MSRIWSGYIIISALAVAAVGALIWKKNKRVYKKVGKIGKLFFYPVKSLKGIEVSEGLCTNLGFEVNGLLDRSFMLISEDNVLLSQRQAPTLALLSTQIVGTKLVISGPDVDPLTIDIKQEPNPKDEIIECKVHTDVVNVVDCGEKAARWFQYFLKKPNIRFVRFFPEFPNRKYVKNDQFFKNFRNKNPISLQDLAAFHILSQSSIDDLNQKISEKNISVFNFRPNILAVGCSPYAEDAWKYMKFDSGAEMVNIVPVTRCLLTTVNPDTGVLTQKEPLTTLRKYRIPKDPKVLKLTGALPCLGTACFLLNKGPIKIHDNIFAVVSQPLQTVQK